MSGTTPPEVDPLDFNQIFSGLQQDQHNQRSQSNGSSFGGYYDHSTPDQSHGQRHRSGSNHSQGQEYPSRDDIRQDSFPVGPSTLIATGNAPRDGRRLSGANIPQHQRQDSGPSAFMGFGDPNGGGQQGFMYTDPVEQYLNNYDDTHGTPLQQTRPQVPQYHTPYQGLDNGNNFASTSTANQLPTPNWGDQFLQDSNFQDTNFQDTNQIHGGNQYESQGGDYNGEGSSQNGLGESSFDANLAEL